MDVKIREASGAWLGTAVRGCYLRLGCSQGTEDSCFPPLSSSSHSPRGEKSEIQVLARLALPEDSGKDSSQASLLGTQLLASPGTGVAPD